MAMNQELPRKNRRRKEQARRRTGEAAEVGRQIMRNLRQEEEEKTALEEGKADNKETPQDRLSKEKKSDMDNMRQQLCLIQKAQDETADPDTKEREPQYPLEDLASDNDSVVAHAGDDCAAESSFSDCCYESDCNCYYPHP